MNKLLTIVFILIALNLYSSQQILIDKQKLNKFINVVQYIQNQKMSQQSLLVKQQKVLQLLNYNQAILNKQIKRDSLYIQNLNRQIKVAKNRKWYQNPLYSSSLGYIVGVIFTTLIVSISK